MKYATLYDGGKVPLLGYGTWRLGGTRTPDYSHDSRVVEMLQTAIDLGYTHIDTAEMYGGGHTEELVGLAIRGYDRRNLQISTKIWQTHLRYDDVFRAFEGSLKRLNCDYVDFYVIHVPSPTIPLRETFRALNELVESGQVRYLGVSNFSVAQLLEAQALSHTPIVMSQVPCSLYHRRYLLRGMLQCCRENGILMAAYSPFERGEVLENPVVKEIAVKYGATPAQVALNWLVSQPGVMVYLMSLNPQHLKENLGALDLDLSPEDMQALDQIELPEEALWPE